MMAEETADATETGYDIELGKPEETAPLSDLLPAVSGWRYDTAVRLRRARTRFIHRFRAFFGLYRGEARDFMLNGIRADLDTMVKSYADLMQTHNRLVNVILSAEDRLSFYEANVPEVRAAKKKYDEKLLRKLRSVKRKQS